MDLTFSNISMIKEDNLYQNNDELKLNDKLVNNDINNSKTIIKDKYNFEKSLEISNIWPKNEETNKNMINQNINEDINFSLNNSIIEKNNNIKTITVMPLKKFKKEDLDYIPLPVFSCIYCSNEYISFNHLSKEILSNKYLFQTSVFDINQLNYIISLFQYKNNKEEKNNKILTIVLKNSEYLKSYNDINVIKEFFKTQKNIIQFKDNKFTKNKNKLIKKIKNKSLLFSSNNRINNYKKLNNISGNEKWLRSPYDKKKNNKKRSNSSLIKDNYNMEINNKDKDKDKNIENGNILEDFEYSIIKRKINKNDIEWDNTFYNIYDPNIDSILDNSYTKNEHELMKIKKNKNKSIYTTINKIRNINIKKYCCYINNVNNINNSIENSIPNKKLAVCNNSKSKSLALTNTSSNIIINNNTKEKDNKFISLFSKGYNSKNKTRNNISSINEKNEKNDNILNDNKDIASFSIINNKNEGDFNSYNRTPSYAKTRIINLYTNSDKQLMKNSNNNRINFKNINKKLLFNYTLNKRKIKIDDENENLKYKTPNTNRGNSTKENKRKNLYSTINLNNIGNVVPNKYFKYKLLLAKTNYENKYIKTLFNKTSYGPKKNSIVKHNNEYCSINGQEQTDNSKLFSIFHDIKSININNLYKDKDIKGKKYNNCSTTHNKSCKKVNYSLLKKIFSDNNKHNETINKEKNKNSNKKITKIILDLNINNKVN